MVVNKMIAIKINSRPFTVPEGTRILDACRDNGFSIPTLCYLKNINEIGACRVCVVEIKGHEQLISTCNNKVKEGMEIITNSPRVREARRTNVELILSQHHTNCLACVRNENCELKQVAGELILEADQYKNEYAPARWTSSFHLVRDAGKCIKCMRCIQICDKVQTLGVWDVSNTGSHTTVDVSFNREIKASDCALCGQCITHCPTAALQERDDVSKITSVQGVLADKDKIVIAQIAPAVRAAWGEEFDFDPMLSTTKRLVSALKAVGFDYVFDTEFSADLTIMEEGAELLERLKNREKYNWPMFTSCCPGWVRFLKSQYPEMIDQLSTAKSPQQMFGAIAKTYFAEKAGLAPDKIVCVSIMPCIAKKMEMTLPGMDSAGTGHDVDYVLTTREICRLIKADHINVPILPEREFDSLLGASTGAGAIFGTSGGVTEAALRSAYYILTGEKPDISPQAPLGAVREAGLIKELEFDIKGMTVRCAVVNSLGAARRLIRSIRRGEAAYDFVEIMACPGGCVGGGGQPIRPSFTENPDDTSSRSACLYYLDKTNKIRFSHENPEIQALYREYLEKPSSEKAHELLHVVHTRWEMPGPPAER